MKRILSLMLAVGTLALGALGITGCGEKKDVIKVGVTDYKPMDYRDDSDNWVGFDAELATKVFENLGYSVEFVEIDWNTKIVTLNASTIDVIWNGMTVTEDLKNNLQLSDVYLENRQYGLVKTQNAAEYTSTESLTGKKVAVEEGSAGEEQLAGITCNKIVVGTQNSAVMEVAAGTSDIAIVDYTMAMTLTAEGSDYYGSLVAVDLGFEVEEYAIGFRKQDTELCSKVNEQIKALTAEGYVNTLAKKYDIENLLKA